MDDRERTCFCGVVGEAVEAFGLVLRASVLLDQHDDLRLKTPEPNRARAMEWLNVSHSVRL